MRDFLLFSVLTGAAATALLDLWNILLNRTLGYPLPNWSMVGRWFLHALRGKVMHENIAASPGFPNELQAGWFFHYAVGIAFAGVMLLIWPGWTMNPALLPALIVGWVTIGCGWFILSPGTGGGIAHSKKPDANRARLLNFLGHTVYGFGLWGAGLILKAVA